MESFINIFWNPHEQRLRALWRLLVLILVFIVVSIAIGLASGLLFLGWAALGQDVLTIQNTIGALVMLAATCISMWLVGRFIDRRPFRDFGFHLDTHWWADLGFGLALGALLMLGIFLVELAAGWVSVTGTLQTASPDQPFLLMILVPLVTFLGVGIYEEMLLRGYMLRNIAEGLHLPAIGARNAIIIAWVLSSIIFGVLHMFNPNATIISTINLMLAGVFLGLAYVLTGELAIPIGLHITWNFFQGNVFGFPVSGGDFSQATFIAIEQGGPDVWTGGAFGPEAGLMGIVAMLVGSGLIVLWVRWRRGSVGLHLPLAQAPARLRAEQAAPAHGERAPLPEAR
jgi:hypothetical protein